MAIAEIMNQAYIGMNAFEADREVVRVVDSVDQRHIRDHGRGSGDESCTHTIGTSRTTEIPLSCRLI